MRSTVVSCVLAVTMLAVGCGGGSGGTDIKAELQRCLGDGATYMLALFASAEIIVDAAASGETDPFPGVTVNPSGVTNQWNFAYALDADGDMLPQSGFLGTITFSADPTDGIDPGDTATILFSLGGEEGLSGNGMVTVTFQAGPDVLVWGDGMIDMPGDCAFEFDIDAGDPMSIGSFPSPAASFFGAPISGILDILARFRSNSLRATIEFPEANNVVAATNVEINGQEIDDFDAEMPFDEETLETLGQCLLLHAEGGFSLIENLLQTITDVVIDGGEFTDGTFTLLAGSTPTSVRFRIDIDSPGFFEPETITGRIDFSEDPTQATGPLSATLSFEVTFPDDIGRVFTTTGDPLVIEFPNFGSSGTLSFFDDESINGEFQCDFVAFGSFPVQEGPELPRCRARAKFTDYNDVGETGFVDLRATVEGNTMRFIVAGGSSEDEGFFSLNGVPLPPQLLFFLLD